MARLGAEKVIGVDVGTEGLENARTRSAGLRNVEFRESSVLALPFPDGAFEMVWCAGVLQHTVDDVRTVDELARVTKAEGYLYLLVYATGGLRWPLIQWLRPLAAQVGQPAIERAIDMSGLPANKRRTFVDDLFCPRIDFYSWGRLEHMLTSRGFGNIERWGPECRLDHEADLESYREDLEALAAVFGVDTDGDSALGGQDKPVFEVARVAVEATIDVICWFEDAVKRGDVSLDSAMSRVIGQGHHRVMARKEA
jgi:SAM-dependent methyltransferase